MQSIEFEPEEIDVAMQWHGGQSSMLYAMASTGALARGVERCRPRVDCNTCGSTGRILRAEGLLPMAVSPFQECGACHGAKMTDAQWLAHLASNLESEAEECADDARKRSTLPTKELQRDIATLESIAAKCREAIATLTGGAS